MTAVSSSLNPSTVGQQVTFTADVTAPGFAGTPTGTVIFTIDGQAETPVPLSVVGGVDQAQYLTTTLTAGQHSVVAAYSGDANVSPSSASLPTQTVNAPNLQSTMTTLTSSSDPSTVGQQVTFTAVVTAPGFAGTPTGSVTFTIDGQAETPVPLSVVGGVDQAQFVTSTLTVGQHSVGAVYSGDTNVSPSSASLPTQTVSPANLQSTTTTLTSSLNPSTVGQQVTFTAVVTAAGFSGTPTGTVTFTIDGQTQTPAALSVVGGVDEAQFVTSTLTVGQHSVTAAYGGETNVSPSSASLPTQTVSPPNLQSTTTTLTSSLNASTFAGERVTFTADVAISGLVGTPTGTVTFTIDGVSETPAPLQVSNGRDQASFSISTLTAGTHTVSASYNGGPTFASSPLSSPLKQTVNSPAREGAPTVVLLQRFGIHMQPTMVVLTFNSGLDPATAQDVRNYRIVGPAGRSIAINSAVYDPTTNTVTLRPNEKINLHHNYQLTVIGSGPGGVASVSDTLLDGAGDGDPGGTYVATLNWKNVVLTPAEIAKYIKPKSAKPAGALAHRFVSRSR